jgi:outer membrane protein OmpA-like peptidoglycan-associated protein
VQFASGKATILPASAATLDEAARVMIEHPEITKVEVEGHTDSTGGKAMNQKLSQKRAEAVRAGLVQRGVSAGRIEAKGYGETRPIAPNDTPLGREANRRVEISIVEIQPRQ